MLSTLARPWLHFVVLGGLLYWGMALAFPEPVPVLGPPTAARLEAQAVTFRQLTQRDPDADEWQRIIDRELRDAMLFREAIERRLHEVDSAVAQRLARNMRFLDADSPLDDAALVARGLDLRLHLTDEVIRRRLVQVMEQLIVAAAPVPEPDVDALRAAYAQRAGQYRTPERFSIAHVYMPADKADAMAAVVAAVEAGDLEPEQARLLGRPFLGGFWFREQSVAQLGRSFGADFADAFAAAPKVPGRWTGPLASVYGLHYVFVAEQFPEAQQPFDAVRDALARDLRLEAEQAALEVAVERMMARYQVRRT